MQTLASGITQVEVDFFRENGYLVIKNALSMDEIEELRRDTISICRGEYGPVRGMLPHIPNETDDEVMRNYLCIHFPHKLSVTMEKYLAHPAIVDVLTKIIGENVKCMQSMLFI